MITSLSVLLQGALFAAMLIEGGAAQAPHPAVPTTNPATWITPLDYPIEIVADGKEGRTSFRLAIDTSGKPSACEVTEKSGEATLDSVTCKLLMERARFHPARDVQGAPVAGLYQNRIAWKIPAAPPLKLGTSETIIEFTVGVDGGVHDCTQERNISGAASIPSPIRKYCDLVTRFEPFRDDSGNTVERRIQIKIEASARLAEIPK